MACTIGARKQPRPRLPGFHAEVERQRAQTIGRGVAAHHSFQRPAGPCLPGATTGMGGAPARQRVQVAQRAIRGLKLRDGID